MPLFEHNYAAETEDGAKLSTPSAALAAVGPVLQVAVSVTREHANTLRANGREVPEPISGFALIDTGATKTAVHEEVCRKLGLKATGCLPMKHAAGVEERACYAIAIAFPGTRLPPLLNPQTMSCDLGGSPYLLLLGRGLLQGLRLVYNGPAGRIEVAY